MNVKVIYQGDVVELLSQGLLYVSFIRLGQQPTKLWPQLKGFFPPRMHTIDEIKGMTKACFSLKQIT